MSDPRSDVATWGSNGSSQNHRGEPTALKTDRVRQYLDDRTYSVSAAVGVGGSSRDGSSRNHEYTALFASVSSMGPRGSASGAPGSSSNGGS